MPYLKFDADTHLEREDLKRLQQALQCPFATDLRPSGACWTKELHEQSRSRKAARRNSSNDQPQALLFTNLIEQKCEHLLKLQSTIGRALYCDAAGVSQSIEGSTYLPLGECRSTASNA